MKYRPLLLAVLAAALAGCAANATAPAADTASPGPARPEASIVASKQARVEVLSAQFGVFGADQTGRRMLFETNKFPAITAAPYGWYIIFKTDKPVVVWREEFELPEAPPTWGPGEAMGVYQISPDRKTAVTERVIPTKLGFIANEWRYAPGDPIGAHAMRVYIDGQLIREFKFAIENAPPGSEREQGVRPGRSRGASST
jgi:hypothetical protein